MNVVRWDHKFSSVVRWHLELGGQVIARIDADYYEFPWTYGTLIDSPEFERFRVYFSDEDKWPETPEFEALLGEISQRGDFILREVAGNVAYRARLNQEGSVVWFRHGDPLT